VKFDTFNYYYCFCTLFSQEISLTSGISSYISIEPRVTYTLSLPHIPLRTALRKV